VYLAVHLYAVGCTWTSPCLECSNHTDCQTVGPDVPENVKRDVLERGVKWKQVLGVVPVTLHFDENIVTCERKIVVRRYIAYTKLYVHKQV